MQTNCVCQTIASDDKWVFQVQNGVFLIFGERTELADGWWFSTNGPSIGPFPTDQAAAMAAADAPMKQPGSTLSSARYRPCQLPTPAKSIRSLVRTKTSRDEPNGRRSRMSGRLARFNKRQGHAHPCGHNSRRARTSASPCVARDPRVGRARLCGVSARYWSRARRVSVAHAGARAF